MNQNLSYLKNEESQSLFGFWVYILSDCLLFATLFATYAVLQGNTFGGPSGKDLFSLPLVFVETMILLVSSGTCGLALLAAHKNKLALSATLLAITLTLGCSFLFMEFAEFSKLVAEGASWQRSGFLSAFFTLVGTHGLHVAIGSVWLLVLIVQMLRGGLSAMTMRQLMMAGLFWHFLDVVWIFIFSFVYLMALI